MDYNMKGFVAYSRKLLRSLKDIKESLDNGDVETAKKKLQDLIDDTQSDIEA